jgi:hypothetical protein
MYRFGANEQGNFFFVLLARVWHGSSLSFSSADDTEISIAQSYPNPKYRATNSTHSGFDPFIKNIYIL